MTGKMKSYQQLYVGMNYFANFVDCVSIKKISQY